MLFSLKLFVAAGLVSNSMSEVVLFEAEMVNRFGISTIQRYFINVILVTQAPYFASILPLTYSFFMKYRFYLLHLLTSQ